jgi:hypothetical protein
MHDREVSQLKEIRRRRTADHYAALAELDRWRERGGRDRLESLTKITNFSEWEAWTAAYDEQEAILARARKACDDALDAAQRLRAAGLTDADAWS